MECYGKKSQGQEKVCIDDGRTFGEEKNSSTIINISRINICLFTSWFDCSGAAIGWEHWCMEEIGIRTSWGHLKEVWGAVYFEVFMRLKR